MARYPFLSGPRAQFPGTAAAILNPGAWGRFLHRGGNIKKFTWAREYPSSTSNFLPPVSLSRHSGRRPALSSVRKTRGRKFPEGEIILGRNRRAGNQRNDARKEREKKDRSIRNRERTGNLISRIAFALNRASSLLFLSRRGRFTPPSPLPLQRLRRSFFRLPSANGRKKKKKWQRFVLPPALFLPTCPLIFNEPHRPDGFTHRPLARTLTL